VKKYDPGIRQGILKRARVERPSRRPITLGISRFVLPIVATGGVAYFLMNASLVTICIAASGTLLLIIGLIRVAAWGLDNTPPTYF